MYLAYLWNMLLSEDAWLEADSHWLIFMSAM